MNMSIARCTRSRGYNTSTTVTDIAGRTLSVMDAAGNVTTTAYDAHHDLPATITDAQGNTACYKYDARGRKIAEWGTALQPACFGYDDMDNMTTLRTFRADNEVITTDPSERSDYDETTWTFNTVTGLEMTKTYADNTSVVKTYDAFNRIETETDARGNVKTHSYEFARGLHLGTSYAIVGSTAATAARSFTYNHLGQMTQLVDDAGICALGYNSYGEHETDSLVVDGDTHLITETRDSFGRSTGYTYAKNGSVQQTVSTSYGDDGRISSAGFQHGGAAKNFGYTYLAGSNLLQVLAKPNGMTLTQTYEATRNLLTGMAYHRSSTLVAQRTYTYDILGRPTTRNTARQGAIVNDTFAHNSRSELVAAQVNNKDYEYTFDNVGNRQSSVENNDSVMYNTNELNQYTVISENGASTFEPLFDVDGNQTLIKTETGTWVTTYDTENRAVCFTNTDSNTIVECAYDSLNRRTYKKVTSNGTVTLHQRYIYRGFLQIACVDLTRSHHPTLWFITWDPSQPYATRPLAIQINGTWYTYGWDLTKNICELFDTSGYIRATYLYEPYGKSILNNSIDQPIQMSSEYYDSTLGLSYYNYRYYNSKEGRWLNYDPISFSYNLYSYVNNLVSYNVDYLGLAFEKKYSEHLNEENKVSNKPKATGRGVTRHPAEFSYEIEIDKKKNKCKLILKGGIKLSVHVLKKGHALYKKKYHEKRYDKKWGKNRNDDTERAAVIAHEYDHRDTYIDLFDKGLSKLNTEYDGKYYDNSKAANKAGKKAVKEAKRLYKKAVKHSKRFDEAGRNYGGTYTTYPFNVN